MTENYSVIYGWKEKFYSPSGSDECPEFGYVKEQVLDYDDAGKKIGSHEEIVFKKTGSYSLTDYINSFEDTTDLKKIFERYQMGDVSVLTKRVGDFVDTVGCPETLLDAQLMLKNGELLFNSLPGSIKEKYENDPLKFVQACQDGSISDVFSGLEKDKDNKVQSQQDEITRLKNLLDEGGIKYE